MLLLINAVATGIAFSIAIITWLLQCQLLLPYCYL
jgi:hypothetical protein